MISSVIMNSDDVRSLWCIILICILEYIFTQRTPVFYVYYKRSEIFWVSLFSNNTCTIVLCFLQSYYKDGK